MIKAGIREARQNLSKLIAEVAKGREVTITDRGKAVARLVAPRVQPTRGFPDLSEFRERMPVFSPPVSGTLIRDREEGR